MPKRIRFPRNEDSRRDRIAQSDIPFKQARSVASRNDAIAGSALGSDAALTITLTGTAITSGVTEENIVDGAETLIITISGDTWAPTLGADNAITTAFLAAITGDGDYATIAALTDYTDVARTSDTIATITYPAAAGYAITEDETVNVSIDLSTIAGSILPKAKQFTITNEA